VALTTEQEKLLLLCGFVVNIDAWGFKDYRMLG
jgi:hypothetical protein